MEDFNFDDKIEKKFVRSTKDFLVFIFAIILITGFSVLIFLRLNKIGEPLFFVYNIFLDLILYIYFIFRFNFGPEKTRKEFFSAKTVSIILILVSVLISLRSYSVKISKNLGPISWEETFVESIKPSLRSVLCAILLFSSVLVRYGTKNLKGFSSYVLLVLDILFISSFFNILCNNEAWPIPFLVIDNQTFLILAIIFSWIGISAVSGFIWLAIFVMGILRMAKIENLMGFSSVAYLICAFVSLILQLKVFNLQFSFVKEFFASSSKRIKNDLSSSANLIGKSSSYVPNVSEIPKIKSNETSRNIEQSETS